MTLGPDGKHRCAAGITVRPDSTREEVTMANKNGEPSLPPRWFMRLFWSTHRRVYRWTGGRIGLWRPGRKGWGAMRVTTIGRRTGKPHPVIVGYFEDGPNLVVLAMNGWGPGEPAWWLNLQAQPDVRVELPDGPRLVTAHAAHGDERARLWARWAEIDKGRRQVPASTGAGALRRPAPTSAVLRRRFDVESTASTSRVGPPTGGGHHLR